ncbi:nucleotide-binding protein [Bradyrhizobium sp. SSUT112]|uniref:nucleotide-binding protein n=1 Tax=Bradyrhizobium sp. SSUT112 TaxID=3040604 RepID=UPI002446AADD|nr:nucleotide-binding protein [Bradyrhizobium sp. SSUT112]MDH2353845.1 nucleotide-binding protein [Bradyrhizobium sp. SSUT112]
MATHHGTFEELQAAVASIGCIGEWQSKPNEVYRFVCKDRSGLNWSSTKGTIWFDGPQDAKIKLQAALEAALNGGVIAEPVPASNAQMIFVVHGHDSVAREQLELVLHKLGLQPFVLQNTDGGGLTIVESLEKMIGKNAVSSFGIVLLTPDDMGYAKKDGETESKPRARQNVILEMGMLLSSLTRERVAILQKGFVEHPSDVAGIIYIPFNEHVKETVPKLAGRLQAAGIKIDGTAIAHASA